MSFDYEDFIFGNKNENYRRIQTRPTIKYNQYEYDTYYHHPSLQSKYYDYYQSSYDIAEVFNAYNCDQHANKDEARIDGVTVTMQFYYAQILAVCEDNHFEEEEQTTTGNLNNSNDNNNNSTRWNWRNHVPLNHRQENDALDAAIAASLADQYIQPVQVGNQQNLSQEKDLKTENKQQIEGYYKTQPLSFAKTRVRVFGHKIKCYPESIGHQYAKFTVSKIASNAWDVYKHNLRIKNKHYAKKSSGNSCNCYYWRRCSVKCRKRQALKAWKCSERLDADSIKLSYVLDDVIPELFTLYDMIFEFMGYNVLKIRTANAILKLAPISKPHSNGLSGNRYCNKTSKFEKRRRHKDYMKDAISYIPTRLYYRKALEHELDSDAFHAIGEYNSLDWQKLLLPYRKLGVLHHEKTKRFESEKYDFSGIVALVVMKESADLPYWKKSGMPDKNTILTVDMDEYSKLHFQIYPCYHDAKPIYKKQHIPIRLLKNSSTRDIGYKREWKRMYGQRFNHVTKKLKSGQSRRHWVQRQQLKDAETVLRNLPTRQLIIATKEWKLNNKEPERIDRATPLPTQYRKYDRGNTVLFGDDSSTDSDSSSD